MTDFPVFMLMCVFWIGVSVASSAYEKHSIKSSYRKAGISYKYTISPNEIDIKISLPESLTLWGLNDRDNEFLQERINADIEGMVSRAIQRFREQRVQLGKKMANDAIRALIPRDEEGKP